MDPFAGSGTTVLAAVKEGYDATGIEVTDVRGPRQKAAGSRTGRCVATIVATTKGKNRISKFHSDYCSDYAVQKPI